MNAQAIQNTIDALKADKDALNVKLTAVVENMSDQAVKREAYTQRIAVLDGAIASMEELKTVVT